MSHSSMISSCYRDRRVSLLAARAFGRDDLRVHPRPAQPAEETAVLDLHAAVLDHFQPRGLGAGAGGVAVNAQLHPQDLRADGDRVLGDGGDLGRLPEAVHDVHLLRDVPQRLVAALAQDGVVARVHRDHPVAVFLHVLGRKVARAMPLGRKAHHGDRLVAAKDPPDLVAIVHTFLMNSTLKAVAALLGLAALPAMALNHEDVVNPLPPGRFAVACSNVAIDTARLAQLGGTAADYYEGHTVNGETRYVTDILAHPESAFRFQERIPLQPQLYPTLFGQRPDFVVLVCHPTSRTNTDANYKLPDDGGIVPHMQPAGQPPKIISASEYAQASGLPDPQSSAPAQLPLIVYSHGLGGSPVGKGYIDVAVQLAAQGYMVAAVFHADNRYSPVRIENLADFAFAIAFFPVIVQMQALRPFALKAMTDHLIADGDFGPAIDRSRIGAFGASLGGEAVAHLVGAGLTTTLAHDCSPTERDPRIRAAVGYVPYSGQSFLPAFCDGQSGADSVDKPYLAISGTLDITAPIHMTEIAVNRMPSSHYLIELVGGQHELRPEDAGDVLTWMVTYFNAYLDVPGDPTAMARFIKMRQVTGGREDNIIVDVHVPFAN